MKLGVSPLSWDIGGVKIWKIRQACCTGRLTEGWQYKRRLEEGLQLKGMGSSIEAGTRDFKTVSPAGSPFRICVGV